MLTIRAFWPGEMAKKNRTKFMTQIFPVPVTVLTGFLGSGKTTLINHLLATNPGERIAIVENEFGPVNIDS